MNSILEKNFRLRIPMLQGLPSTNYVMHWVPLPFSWNEHPGKSSWFLYTKIVVSNIEKFGYDGYPLTTSSFLWILLFVVSRTQCFSMLEAGLCVTLLVQFKTLNNKHKRVAQDLDSRRLWKYRFCSQSMRIAYTVTLIWCSCPKRRIHGDSWA